MKHLPLSLSLIILCGLSNSSVAQTVSTPAELGPYDFWSHIESTNGAIAPVSDRGASDTGVEIVDPVILGIAVPGIITVDNQMTVNGPSTWLNVALRFTGQGHFDKAEINITSEVTYDLAAFGSSSEAEVRIIGGGISGNKSRAIGMLSRADISVAARIVLYETDAFGNLGNTHQAWFIERTSGFYTEGEPAYIRLNETFTLDTNRLYKVVIYSRSTITLVNTNSLDLSAYALVDPLFSSETEGVEVHVSNYEDSESLRPIPPERVTVRSDGATTSAMIAAGVSLTSSDTFAEDFNVDDTIRILASIQPEASDVSATAEVFVIVGTDDEFFQITQSGLIPFDGSVGALQAFDEITLRGNSEIDLLAPFGGELTLSDEMLGQFNFYVGYRIGDGIVTYTEEAVLLNVIRISGAVLKTPVEE